MDLQATIADLYAQGAAAPRDAAREAFARLRAELGCGRVRAAEPDAAALGGWRVNAWVKQGILLGIRAGDVIDVGIGKGRWPFVDYDTLPLKRLDPSSGVRLVPGGSSVRDGAYLGAGVVCLPPMYIDIGAFIGDGTIVDSHALVGACAQIGRRVLLDAGAQVGGALEPVDAMPVVVEDEARIGGHCGIYGGVIVRRRAVLASGTIVSGATPIYDLPNGRIITPEPGGPLVVPEGAVVVAGSRRVSAGAGREWGLSLATPVIVQYRDGRSDPGTDIGPWIE